MNVEEELFGIKKRTQAINSKRKGNVNEAKLTKILLDWTGHEFARVPRSGGLRWKNRMDICGDVINVDPEFDFPFSVETKHVANLGLHADHHELRSNSVVYKYWDQCQRDAKTVNKTPMLLIRQNGMMEGSYYLFMELDNFQIEKLSGITNPNFTSSWGHTPKLSGYWSPAFFKRIDYETFKKIMK